MAVTGNEPLSTGDLLAVMQAAQTGAFSRCATIVAKKTGNTVISKTGITASGLNLTLPEGVYLMRVEVPSLGYGTVTLNNNQLTSGDYYIAGGSYTLSGAAFDDTDKYGLVSIVQLGGGSNLLDLIAAMGGERS